jgi:outer membrane protein assembly factor BamA
LNTLDMSSDTSSTTLDGIGLKATLDARSSVNYPRSGFVTNVSYTTYPEGFGNEVQSNTIAIDYNRYWSARAEQDVVAARAYVGLGIGDLAFNQQYVVGQNDIRGYSKGQFRGNYLVAVQGEYRFNPWERWGLVGFFGLATVFDGINEADNGKILPGIGTGIRFTAFTENHMNVGMDIAVGNGDWGLNFRISEAF